MMKHLVVSLLLILFGVANAQQIDAQTGNIVYTTLNPPPPGTPYTWNGFIIENTGGGGLSGGYTPAYNTNTGTFIFGYNQGTVNYTTAVNFALANAGLNIQVNGFKYRWEYYNQDFSRGTLTGNISLTNSSGNVVQSYNYNMPQTTNGWTWMNGTQTFNTQYASTSLGNLQVSFTGKDDRYWAGYYGPQVRNIDVKLLYSVSSSSFSSWSNLTGENGTFTISSPGMVRYGANNTYIYQNYQPGTYSCSNTAYGQDPLGGVYKSCELGTVSTAPTNPLPTPTPTNTDTTTITNNIISAAAEPISSTSTTTTTATNTTSDPTSTTVLSPTSGTTSNTQTTSSASSSTSTATATPTASVSTTSAPSGGRTLDGTSIGLSVVARNATREQAIAMQASQNAIAQADQASQQAQQDAVGTAQLSSSNSVQNITNSSNRLNVTQQRQEQSTLQSNMVSIGQQGFSLQLNQQSINKSNDTQKLITNTVLDSVVNQTVNNVSTNIEVNNTQQGLYSLLPPQQSNILQIQNVSSIKTESTMYVQPTAIQQMLSVPIDSNSDSQKMLLDRSNPLYQVMTDKPVETNNNTNLIQGPAVNRNAQNNEVAGGVDINRIAQAPTGYNEYLNLTLRDASFYAPKEVYKNQKVVDNVRVLRQLSSDRLHQEMVDQQYRR